MAGDSDADGGVRQMFFVRASSVSQGDGDGDAEEGSGGAQRGATDTGFRGFT